jgi:hypothetical protein
MVVPLEILKTQFAFPATLYNEKSSYDILVGAFVIGQSAQRFS